MADPAPHLSPSTPLCVGIIMDGNRRWAKARGLTTLEGHQKGYEKFKEVAEWCKEVGVKHLAVYAFSTENWHRAEEEVGYLMDLMRTLLREGLPVTDREDVAVHIVGDSARFPSDIQELIADVHAKNVDGAERHLWVCASYGGKPEILAGIRTLMQAGKREVTDEELTAALWTADLPEPDMIIRTGGEKRLSNFLLWHSGYSELFFLDTYWPDFSREEFDTLLVEFAGRKRNYGK